MIVTGRILVEQYFEANRARADIRAAMRQFDAWLAEATGSVWRTPIDVKTKYRNASILKSGRIVFNISGNKYRLIVRVNYPAWVVEIRFFGSHAEYDRIDVETV